MTRLTHIFYLLQQLLNAMPSKRFVVLVFICVLVGCQHHDGSKLLAFAENQMVDWNRKLTDVIVTDIFTPPVASRIYAYPNIAAYEALRWDAPENNGSLTSILNNLESGPSPEIGQEYHFQLSGVVAFAFVAKSLVYNREAIEKLLETYLNEIKSIGIDETIYRRSVKFGEEIGEHILNWAQNDGYLERTSLIRYQVDSNPGRWRPTPPDYMEAIEPNWNTLRPFVLDSASQFSPGAPTSFDTLTDSQFYQETMHVYNTVNEIDEDRLAIAKFWDCNPNISFTKGHVMYFHQQISPGGHWVHITAQVIDDQNLNMLEAAKTFSKVCITIADAFISCWDEKYNSSLVRPETYINEYIDKDWHPILQTPAFPEHTSGHSVASASAAVMLTSLFGKTYKFIDSTEVPFGLPARSYSSFQEAADEAAISRLYGGIHYQPAIEKGVMQGKNIGHFVVEKLETLNTK